MLLCAFYISVFVCFLLWCVFVLCSSSSRSSSSISFVTHIHTYTHLHTACYYDQPSVSEHTLHSARSQYIQLQSGNAVFNHTLTHCS